jgi:hypothetical protein
LREKEESAPAEITLWKSKITLILSVLRRLIPNLLDKASLSLLFCAAVPFLYEFSGDYLPLYAEAVSVVLTLTQHLFFSKVSEGFVQTFLTRMLSGRAFGGIQRFLYVGLCFSLTSPLAAQLLVALIPISSPSLLGGSPVRVFFAVLGLLPWMHRHLLSAVDFRDPRFFVTDICQKLILSLQLCPEVECAPLLAGILTLSHHLFDRNLLIYIL